MPLPSPFSMEQQRWIIFRYGACPSVKTIRREYRQKIDVPPFDVPGESLTIEQLMSDVNDFASQLDQETVKKAVVISRAGCCLDN